MSSRFGPNAFGVPVGAPGQAPGAPPGAGWSLLAAHELGDCVLLLVLGVEPGDPRGQPAKREHDRDTDDASEDEFILGQDPSLPVGLELPAADASSHMYVQGQKSIMGFGSNVRALIRQKPRPRTEWV